MQKGRAVEGLPFITADGTTLFAPWKVEIISNTLKLSNSVLVRVPINIYYYEQMTTLFVILLAETPVAWFNSM